MRFFNELRQQHVIPALDSEGTINRRSGAERRRSKGAIGQWIQHAPAGRRSSHVSKRISAPALCEFVRVHFDNLIDRYYREGHGSLIDLPSWAFERHLRDAVP